MCPASRPVRLMLLAAVALASPGGVRAEGPEAKATTAELQPRLTIPKVGRSQFVNDLAFSPDGKTLVSTGWWGDGSIRLWDVETGEPRAVLKHVVRESEVEF